MRGPQLDNPWSLPPLAQLQATPPPRGPPPPEPAPPGRGPRPLPPLGWTSRLDPPLGSPGEGRSSDVTPPICPPPPGGPAPELGPRPPSPPFRSADVQDTPPHGTLPAAGAAGPGSGSGPLRPPSWKPPHSLAPSPACSRSSSLLPAPFPRPAVPGPRPVVPSKRARSECGCRCRCCT